MRCVYLLLIFMASIPAIAQEKMEIFDEIQENVWYLPTEDGKAKLYISSLGAGDTVVVLHGGPGNNFNYLVDAVRGNLNDHCFLFFDQRGSIYSPVPDSSINELTLSQLVDDLETLRKATGQEKLTLLGHSFGSLLAISYYIKYPQSVERIILSGAMPPSVSEEHPFSELVKDIHARVKAFRERPEVEEILIQEGLFDEERLTAKQRSDRYKITGLASFNMVDLNNWRKFKGGGIFYNPSVDGAIGNSIPGQYDVRTSLDSYPVPFHIIQGSQDYIDPDASLWTAIAKNYSTVSISVVEGTSHYIWLDKPKEFTKILGETLRVEP